ncbi:MAG: hypothetical protein LBD47_13935 [Treponema sp.]|nr:hypothetical protein [Treponema sp.]
MTLKTIEGNGGRLHISGQCAVSGMVQEGFRNGRRKRNRRLCPAYFPLVNKIRGGRSGNSIS